MTPERYKRLTDWLEGHPALREGIILLNRWLPLVPFVCYPVLLVLLNLRWFTMLTIGRGGGALDFMQVIARAILVPGLAFGLGTILRARLNFPRPYEQPGFVPLVSKETHGNSCPSRHALSAAVLGVVWLYFYPAVGVVMLAIAASSVCCGCFLGRTSSGMCWQAQPSGLRSALWGCGCCEKPFAKSAKKFQISLDRTPELWYYTSRSVLRLTAANHIRTQWDNNVRP